MPNGTKPNSKVWYEIPWWLHVTWTQQIDPSKIGWKQPKTTSHLPGGKHPRDCLDGGFPASLLKNRILKNLVSGPFFGWLVCHKWPVHPDSRWWTTTQLYFISAMIFLGHPRHLNKHPDDSWSQYQPSLQVGPSRTTPSSWGHWDEPKRWGLWVEKPAFC